MNTLTLFVLLLSLTLPALSAFNIKSTGQTGKALNVQDCNVQTTLDFRFSSSSIGSTSVLIYPYRHR